MNNNIYFFLDSLRFIFTFTADKLVVTNFINMTKTAKKEAEKHLKTGYISHSLEHCWKRYFKINF